MSIFQTSLKALKFPLKLLVSKKRGKKSELVEKCEKHVRNFAPPHYSWQIRAGKKLTKKQKKKNKKTTKTPLN